MHQKKTRKIPEDGKEFLLQRLPRRIQARPTCIIFHL